MIAASAPPRVQERLRAAPDGPVEVLHAGTGAVYVDVGGWCVGVVAPSAAQVPCAMRVTTGDHFLRGLASARPAAYLGGGMLHLDGTPLSIGRLVGAYVPPLGQEASRTDPVTVEATPPATVAGFVARHLPAGRIDAEVASRLLGLGPGLTPLGDDLVAGWLAMHRSAGVPTVEVDAVVDGAVVRTTLLSATLLDCARHGEVLPEFASWVRALGGPAEPAATAALRAVGDTSGTGLHWGGRLALAQLQEAA